MALALAIVCIYGFTQTDPWRRVGAGLLFSFAALMAGAFLGFLFGIPRAASIDGAGDRRPAYTANTNLEQISDWLTKIIVGVSLTQLPAIKEGGANLFDAMAPSLGGTSSSAAFAGAIVVFFSICGFFIGWLATRLFLGQALTAADRAADLRNAAELAEQNGETERADRLRREADAALAEATTLANTYERTRASMGSSPDRTRILEGHLSVARALARDEGLSEEAVAQMFDSGGDGERITAIAYMQARPQQADLSRLAGAVSDSRSAFEQYHALLALKRAVEVASGEIHPEDRTLVLSTARAALEQDRLARDSDRRELAEWLVANLSQSRDGSAR